jgi:hypothetical protein
MPSTALPRAVTFAVLAIGLAATFVVAWLLANDPSEAPWVAPGSEASAVVHRPTAEAGMVAARSEPTARNRVEPPSGRATLRGRLLDAAGVPIAGYPVELEDDRKRGRGEQSFSIDRSSLPPLSKGDSRITGVDGSFDFAELAPGTFRLRCGFWRSPDSERSLAAGETAFVELRIPPTLVLVSGNVILSGVPATEAMVSIVSADSPGAECTARNAGELVQALIKPGRYELRTWSHRLGRPGIFHRQPLLVPDGVARVAFTMPFGGTTVEVAVHGECASGRDGIGIDVNGTPTDDAQSRYLAIESRVGESRRFVLPAGTWRVTVSGPGIAQLPERVCAIEPDTPPIHIEHETRPGAVVRLDLVDPRGEPVWVAPELLPNLFAQGSSCPCVTIEERTRARPVGYRAVPLGPALLQWEDRFDSGARTFLPFEPLPALDLVVAAEGNAVPLVVQRRPWVDLRACDRTGREDCFARIMVFAGNERVRGRDEEAPQRWSGWLPPGDYRAVIERTAGQTERLIAVGRDDLALRLRP